MFFNLAPPNLNSWLRHCIVVSIMNSQGTGEKNNDERTIRQETNETKQKNKKYKLSDGLSAKAKSALIPLPH